MKRSGLFIAACAMAAVLYADQQVINTKVYQQEGASLRIFEGTVDLPAQGIWVPETKSPDLFIEPPKEAYRQLTGRRMAEVLFNKRIERGRFALSSICWASWEYAREHGDEGPSSVSDLDTNRYRYAINSFKHSPWGDLPENRKVEEPYYYLIPDVPFKVVGNERIVRREDSVPLAFELHPYVNDGKHWVVYTDRHSERVEIDPDMVERYGQVIQPVFEENPYRQNLPASYTYSVFSTKADNAAIEMETIPLRNNYTGEQLDAVWDLAKAEPGDDSLFEKLREYRSDEWRSYLQVSDAPALRTWMALAGIKKDERRARRGRQRRGESTSIFGVMGGYAAVRETLQMQAIDSGSNTGEQTVAIESLSGVEVKSHPYAEMLGDQPGGRLELANLAPRDHLFVYLGKPESMLPMLDSGADFMSELGRAVTGNSITYSLKARYLKRLGMNEAWLEQFLKSGGITECALFAPDMFFIDGTDVTVVSRMSNPRLIIPLLKMIGVPTLSDQKFAEFPNADGNPTYWTIRDDLLLLSTSKEELQLVVDLQANGGEGSLGKSAEFRYMLTRLPVDEATRCYAYCSDPFIRRLVSPSTKIGQLRRLTAMNQLRMLSSAALLAKEEGFGNVQSIDQLQQQGYLPDGFDAGNQYSLDADLVAHSATYGTLANPATIGSVPIEMVTAQEADGYKRYVDNYSRFWRQFFDPIAFRLDDTASDELEASVYILPLIDSSIYNGIKGSVMPKESGVPLKTPVFSPDPVLQFSLNLNEQAWQGIAKGMSDMLTRYVMVDPAIVDDLGPGLHLSISDGDPVIALGSGDIFGAFGGNIVNMGNEMLMIPIMLSILTRPSTLAVETSNPEKTIMFLRNATDSFSRRSVWGRDEIHSELYQIEGRDEWVCLFDIMGVVRLRYGLEVRDGFLLIRNIPWSNADGIEKVENAPLNGMELKVWPGACKLQLPGLFYASAEKQRQAALQGLGFVYPLLSSGYATIDNVFDQHMKLFGFTPVQSTGDHWDWSQGVIESTRYGSVLQKKQPDYAGGDDFGLLGAIRDLELQTQFEDTGLRATIKWRVRGE